MKLNSRFLLSFVAAVAACACSAFAGDNLVVNGDFEAAGYKDNFKENCGSDYLIGWTCNQAGICMPKGTYLKTDVAKYNDSAWAFLKKVSSFSQDITLGCAGTYRLEFDYCLRDNCRTKASTFVTFGTEAVTNILGDAGTDTCKKPVHMSFDLQVMKPGTYTLKFEQKVGDDASPAFDNISLVLTSIPVGIQVASSPANVGEVTPGFGVNFYDAGTQVACQSSTEVVGETVKYHLAGWSMNDDGVVTTGGPTGIVHTVGQSMAELTWLWSAEYKLTVGKSGTGTVEDKTGWYAEGSEVTLTAGDGFVTWLGDIDVEQERSQTITVTMDRARSLTAVFGGSVSNVRYSRLYEYLESDGTQLIDLGVKMQKKTFVDVYFQRCSSATTVQKFFGALNGTAGASLGCGNLIAFSASWGGRWTPAVSVGGSARVRMQVETAFLPNGGYQFKESDIAGYSSRYTSEDYKDIKAQDLTYYAFGVNVSGGEAPKGAVRIEKIVILSDCGELLHDWRPAKVGDELGLYDLVTDKFCGNIADGARGFVTGPETLTTGDVLQIETDPARLEVGAGAAFASRTGLAADDEIAVSAPELDSPRLKATCTGWTLYSLVGGKWLEETARENHSGTGKSFTYRHTGCASRLVWHYTLSDPGATAEESVKYVWFGCGKDTNDGASWAKAFASIKAALAAASEGDTILVGPAQYDLSGEVKLSNGHTLVSACGATRTVLHRHRLGRAMIVASGTAAVGFTVTGGAGGYDGGGVQVNYGRLSSCIVTNNTAGGGAGVYTWGGILENSLICENAASGNGGGVYVYHGTLVRHCTIANNNAGNGGGMYCTSTWGDKGHDLIVWGNTANANADIGSDNGYNFTPWTNICSSVAVGVDPQTADPLFVSVAKHDYRLAGSSPYRDAAWGTTTLTTDALGNVRVQNGRMDVGAIESDPSEKSANMEMEIEGGLDTATVDFRAKATNFDIADAVCYWTFDGRTPTAADHDATGAELTREYTAAGTYSVALAVVFGSETFYDTKENFLTVSPSRIYVDAANAQPAYPYNTPETAANGLAEAVETAAASGSTITVKPGTYVFPAQVVIKKSVKIHSEQGPQVTVFDGGGKVSLLNSQVASVEIAGFTFARGGGGGHAVRMEAGVLTNCVICGTTGAAGLYLHSPSLVTGCVISNNTSTTQGGGVYTWGGTLENSLICGNTSGQGGGLFLYHGATIRNCTISGNTSTGEGGGVWYATGWEDVMRNTIIWGNEAAVSPDINTNNISVAGWKNNCSSVGLGENTSKRDLVANPLFVKPAKGDYRIRPMSPCRDSAWGDPTTSVDLGGRPRVLGKRMDIGCYECDQTGGMRILIR